MKHTLKFLTLWGTLLLSGRGEALRVNYVTNLSEPELLEYKQLLAVDILQLGTQKVLQLFVERAALTNRFSKVQVSKRSESLEIHLWHKIRVEDIVVQDASKQISQEIIDSVVQGFIIQPGDYVDFDEEEIIAALKKGFLERGYRVSFVKIDYRHEESTGYRAQMRLLVDQVSLDVLDSITLVNFANKDIERLLYHVNPPDNVLKRLFYTAQKVDYIRNSQQEKTIRFNQRHDAIKWRSIVKDFSEEYRSQGYYDFKVSTRAHDNLKDVNLKIVLNKGPRYKIRYVGNVAFWDRQLKDLVEKKYYKSFFSFNEGEAKRTLVQEYLKKGYRDIKVDAETELVEGSLRKITFYIDEGEVFYVDDVIIVGAEYVDSSLLKAIQEEFWDHLYSFADKRVFDEDKVESTGAHLCALFRKRGYYFCEIKRLKPLYSKYRNLLRLKFFVDPGDRFVIAKVNIPEPIASLNFERIISKGDFLSPRKITEQLSILSTYLDNAGYRDHVIETDLSKIIVFRKNSYAADLSLQVSRGEQIFLGNTIVAGNSRVRDGVILRELGSRTIAQGDIWSLEKLKKLEEALLGLGLFSEVKVEGFGRRKISDGKESKKIIQDMRIVVKESYFGGIEFGPGFRTDEGFIGFAEFNYNNLWKSNRAISLSSRVSRKVSDALFVAQKYSLSYLEPYFLGSRSRLRLSASYEKSDKTTREEGVQVGGFALQEFSADASLDFYVSNSLRVVLDLYSLDLPEVFNFLDSDTTVDTERFKIASSGISLIYDKRDNIFNPKKGVLITTKLSNAHPRLGSDRDAHFLLSDSRFTYYLPFSADAVLAFSGAYGRLWAQGEASTIPPSERFFLGGATSIRSLSERFLGSSEAGVLNQEYYQTKLEYRQVIFDKYLIAPFIDGGYVNSFSKGVLSNGEFPEWRWAAGVGFRYDTPIGPVALDIGFNLNPQLESEDAVKIHFSVGSF